MEQPTFKFIEDNFKEPEAFENKVEQWKKEHGEVFQLTVEDKVGFLKAPDRNVLSLAYTVAGKDKIKLAETILENCWLDGDTEIKDNDTFFLSAVSQIDAIVELKDAELKKL